MDIRVVVNETDEASAKNILANFLESYMSPAFGALPKGEVELMVLTALVELGAIDSEPEVYELVSRLRITRSKARGLIYDRELRNSTTEELDEKVKTLLKRPLLQKNGELFILEIENPLVSDHLRSRVQRLRYVSDGSFSPNIVKLGIDAVSALIGYYLSREEQDQIKQVLISAGFPDGSFSGVLKGMLRKVGQKVAADSGEALLENVSNFISPIIDSTVDVLRERTAELFEDVD